MIQLITECTQHACANSVSIQSPFDGVVEHTQSHYQLQRHFQFQVHGPHAYVLITVYSYAMGINFPSCRVLSSNSITHFSFCPLKNEVLSIILHATCLEDGLRSW
jgi:hypothetical protein